MNKRPTLYIFRGIPGTGKSTKAKELAHKLNILHVEADMYFSRNGQYQFDHTKLNAAHSWCLNATKRELKKGHSVVVSNTFTKYWELENYLVSAFELNAKVIVVQCRTEYGNIHGVSDLKMAIMRNRFEDNSDLEKMTGSSEDLKYEYLN